MLKIKFFADWCNDEEIKNLIINQYDCPKNTIITTGNDYTHAVIFNTCMPELNIPKENVIGIAQEPVELSALNNKFYEYVKKYVSKYYVGSRTDNMPEEFIEYYNFMFYTKDNNDIKTKNKIMSIIFSDKQWIYGHKYRHLLVNELLKLGLEIDIYGRGCKNLNLQDKRIKGEFIKNEPYDDYKFSIAIENTIHNTYISEKFINCLMCNTVPIYYGCKNIEKYFPKTSFKLTGILKEDIETIEFVYENHEIIYNEYKNNIINSKKILQSKYNLLTHLSDIFSINIFLQLKGGVGNQLFQFFTGLAYCLENNYKLKINNTILSQHGESILSKLNNFITDEKCDNKYNEINHYYDKIPLFNKNTQIDGYFQSDLYFKNHYEEIYNILNLDEIKNKLLKYKINNSVSLHIRLNDYKKFNDIYILLDENYYIKALEHLKEINPTVIIFNDKVDEIESIELTNKLINIYPEYKFIKSEKLTDLEEIILMSLCDHNIIANSTFSWWGAYLNDNINKKVICPDKYFINQYNPSFNIKDLYPESWIKININYTFNQLINIFNYLIPKNDYIHMIEISNLIDFDKFDSIELFNQKYNILDYLYMSYYYTNNIKGCQETLKKFEYAPIDDHIIDNSNHLFYKLKNVGYKIIATTDNKREPKDKEIIIIYGNYTHSVNYLPWSNKLYRHPWYFNQVNHDSIESDERFNKLDQIYILNLEERVDRYKEIMVELCKLNFPLNKIHHFKVKRETLFPELSNYENGAASCTKNHMLMVKDMIKNNYENCLFFEDDFQFNTDYDRIKNDIKKLLDGNYIYDAVFLAVPLHKDCVCFKKYDDLLNISYHKWTTMSGYFLNKKTVQTILDNFEEGFNIFKDRKIPLDLYINKLEKNNKIFMFKNKFGYQRLGYSNIQNQILYGIGVWT